MEKKKIKIGLGTFLLILIVLALVVVGGFYLVFNKNDKNEPDPIAVKVNEDQDKKNETNVKFSEDIEIVPTMKDKIAQNSSWCATFQLVWNDMKNEVVGMDVVLDPQEEYAENLNKEEFTEDMISEEYYYKKYGLKTLELKEEIEKGIKEKFNQESDVLEDIDWSEEALDDPNNIEVKRYLFYTMLYRKFEFLKEFDKLENGKFGAEYEDVKYFGLNESSNDKLRNQVEVLYYNSEDDFAITLKTKSNDEVILCKNPNGDTFEKIYENMKNQEENYKGNKSFGDLDKFKAPNLTFNVKKEYTELQGKPFETDDGKGEIHKAIQTIKFTLDEKGGEVKSEAVIDMTESMAIIDNEVKEPRYFYLDDTFAIFLKEADREKPYFAGRIEDISKFQ